MKHFLAVLFAFSLSVSMAQSTTFYNSGFEDWHGGFVHPEPGSSHEVKCCGVTLSTPTLWSIPELLMAMPTNVFVYKETDTAYIHSGYFSARLFTNTTMIDSAGDTTGTGLPTVLVPGPVTCAGIVGYGSMNIDGDLYKNIMHSNGEPFADTPNALNFYMRFDHEEPDTARYAYVFTRWDSVAHREDTLAVHDADIPDSGQPANTWIQFSDNIHYLLPGSPDTMHLIFYGGRNANPDLAGNNTWLDDISFYYGSPNSTGATGIVHMSTDDAVSIYPDPPATEIHVRVDDYMTGYTIELYDVRGSCVMRERLNSALSSYPIGSLSDGLYLYRLTDRSAATVTSGKVTVRK